MTDETEEFTLRIREFLSETAVPREGSGTHEPAQATAKSSVDLARDFQRQLFAAGLAGLTWPREYGGAGLTDQAQAVFTAEASAFVIPQAELTLSLNVCGPALLQFGTNAQKMRHVEPTLRGEHVWCQLWSEPEAGSDLAAVRTLATPRDSGGWTVSGQKIWTSGAHYADFGLLLCRTDRDGAKHAGLSMLIIDMRQAGVTIRPLRQMAGDAHFNEVFLDEVLVDEGALLGELGQGWPITTWMMSRERVSVGLGMRNAQTLDWNDVLQIARDADCASEPAVRQKLAELHIRERAAQMLGIRISQQAERGEGSPLLGSAVKIVEAAAIRESAELALELAGVDGTTWSPGELGGSRIAVAALASPGFAIGGGTDDIQLNTLAEHLLGLPREPRVENKSS